MNKNVNRLVFLTIMVVLVVSVAAVSALSFSQAAPQSANHQERYHERFSSNRAFAELVQEDEETGIYTRVFIHAGDSSTKGPDADSHSSAFVGIFQYTLEEECHVYYGQTYCYYVEVPILDIFGETELQDSDFKASNSLRTASLVTQITGIEFLSGEEKTVNIDAKWTGYGEAFKGRFRLVEDNDFFKYTETSMGASRQANVLIDVTGDFDFVIEGGSEQPSDEYEEYGQASIGKYKSGISEFIKQGY